MVTFEEIKLLKFNYNGEKRNFLRNSPDLEGDLKSIFGNISRSELNYLIDHEKHFCICGSECVYINHDAGYKEHCITCIALIKRKKLSEAQIGKKHKTFCRRCGIETETSGFCPECKEKFKCLHCGEIKTNRSEHYSFKYVCKDCELDYLLTSNTTRKYSKVNFHTLKLCKECGEPFKFFAGGTINEYCKLHRRRCQVCGGFNLKEQGVTCSNECSRILHEKTCLEKYGVKHNLLIRGAKKSHFEYWTSRGFSIKEGLFNVYISQNKGSKQKLNSVEELFEIFSDNEHLYKTYTREVCETFFNYGKTLKALFDIFVEEREINFGDETLLFKRNTYGFLIYFVYNKEKIILRSKREFKFFLLLVKNGIEFQTNKEYPDSRFMYDFYLPEYNKYIEIVGFKNDKIYMDNLKLKVQLFNSVTLDSHREMRLFIKGLK